MAEVSERTCVRHLMVDEETYVWILERVCVGCGVRYNRTLVLAELQQQCLRRWPPLPPIPSSPWSAEERSYDPD